MFFFRSEAKVLHAVSWTEHRVTLLFQRAELAKQHARAAQERACALTARVAHDQQASANGRGEAGQSHRARADAG